MSLMTRLSSVTPAVVGAGLIALGATLAPAPAQAQPAPLAVLVTGLDYDDGHPAYFDDMTQSLTAAGYRVALVDVQGRDMHSDAAQVSAAVAAAGHASSVALIGHGFGGLSARYYIKSLGGVAEVDRYIGIAVSEYGSPGGCLSPGPLSDGCSWSGFLHDLNRGDDTPGDVAYSSIRSVNELVDGRLDGGQCRFTPIAELPLADHPADPRVIAQVRRALAGHCDGTFVDDPDGAIDAVNSLFPAGLSSGSS